MKVSPLNLDRDLQLKRYWGSVLAKALSQGLATHSTSFEMRPIRAFC